MIAWKQNTFPPPKLGTQWIATYYGPESSQLPDKVARIGHRFLFSEEQLEWTKNYIDREIAARERREQEQQRERDRIRKDDLEIEKEARVKQLYDDASDVVIAKGCISVLRVSF